MNSLIKLRFKIASELWEFKQIHELNYKTFVEEIPQHPGSPDRTLIDKFNAENIYIICISEQTLCGMIAVRDKRPFSLDLKLNNLDSYLPKAKSICEIRLLSIEESRRNGRVIQGLVAELGKYCDERNYDLAIISGTLRQKKLYAHFGFEPFGPLVGSEKAQYQPMCLTLDKYIKLKNEIRVFNKNSSSTLKTKVNLLPGPVEIKDEVINAYKGRPVSHRSDEFMADFKDMENSLCKLVNSKKVTILMGSGTLANDAIAGQLSLHNEKGLILVNGEFGRRLVLHAKAAGLSFDIMQIEDGDTFVAERIEDKLHASNRISWLWSVHCETSTGVINNIDILLSICRKKQIKLCLDCISSIGTQSLNLHSVYLASGVSGKGLGALPGLAMVFHQHEINSSPDALPRYIDLGLYEKHNGVPYTISSNLIYALRASLTCTDWAKRFNDISVWSKILLDRIVEIGYEVVSRQTGVSSAVVTISLSGVISSKQFAQRAEQLGFLLSYNSAYLLQKNRVQICIMRELHQGQLEDILQAFNDLWVEYMNSDQSKLNSGISVSI